MVLEVGQQVRMALKKDTAQLPGAAPGGGTQKFSRVVQPWPLLLGRRLRHTRLLAAVEVLRVRDGMRNKALPLGPSRGKEKLGVTGGRMPLMVAPMRGAGDTMQLEYTSNCGKGQGEQGVGAGEQGTEWLVVNVR